LTAVLAADFQSGLGVCFPGLSGGACRLAQGAWAATQLAIAQFLVFDG
jgi:hypothetical protein